MLAQSARAQFAPNAVLYGNATGSHSINAGTYTISNSSGSGIDGGGTSDGFYSLEQVVAGDFDLSARIMSATDVGGDTSEYERVGLVVRAGATPAANEVSAFVGYDSTSVSNKWAYWITRASVGAGNIKVSNTAGYSLPRYVRIARVGSTVTGYISPDGSTWTSLGSTSRSGELRVGLAWGSDSAQSGSAVFSNVTLVTGPAPPTPPYAWYRADQGVTLDGSGHISNWATQTVSGSDLDRVVGSPGTLTLPRTGGGTATVVDLDGSSALWAAAGDWGSAAGNRTVVARARINGNGDGFLFDGSTGAGLTRAQVRSGMWQAGVQSSGGFANADPDTTGITAQTWQTHVFQYEESGGNTLVTHWVDGTQVGTHSVSIDTSLSGLIIGANGATNLQLDVELAELMVYNRLLTPTQRTDLETDLDTRWGDLTDQAFEVQGSTTIQNPETVPQAGTHGVVALELTSTGNLGGDAVTSLTFNLNGTTDATDITELQLYSSTDAVFNLNNATLLATVPAVAGTVSVNAPVTASKQYLWIAAKLAGSSTTGDFLDAEITEFVLTGPSAGTHIPTVTAPAGNLTIQAGALYSTVIRKEGDDGSASYRIPGLATSNAGTLLAVFDIRWANSGDLPGDIDVGLMRSTDGGFTWGPMQTIMDFDKNIVGSSGNGVGDPSILVDRVNGRIWCAALHSFGNNGWAGSGPGLAKEDTGQFVLNYSDDDGVTWSAPASITSAIKDPAWNLYFNGPGKGICTRDGVLVFPAQYKDAGGNPRSNFIYSTDRGVTWVHGPPAIASGNPQTTEAQIVELDSGDLLISMRNHAGNGQRLWCIYSWNHDTETIADGSWGSPWYEQTDPVVMASVQRFSSVLDGDPWSGLLFANPDSGSREKMSIRLSIDEGKTWPYKRKIDDRPAAYSCMTMLPDGDIGIFYETGDSGTYQTMTFARFSLEWLVGSGDSDGDGISDFEEDRLRRVAADTEPYAWYRGDLGVTANGSNQVTNWATQTSTAADLDNMIGNPTLSDVAQPGGGTTSVVTLDGGSAVWVGSGNWGALASDRTVVVHARLNGSGDGFLFDGSTGSGKTRAQIRNGTWQAGVQASGSPFTAADPDTGNITAHIWQTHIFEFDENGGSTTVTHQIDGAVVGSHTVTEDVDLGGLILGAHGGAGAFLAVDLAEIMVYDRLLDAADRSDIAAWFNAHWGDLNTPLAYQSSTVVQTASTVPKIGIHGVAALELTSDGLVPQNTVTSVSYNMNGSTNSSDIAEVRLYDSGTSNTFDPASAMLLATQSPPAGSSGSFAISHPITSETQHLWIAVKLRGTSGNGDLLDAEITEFVLTGDDAGTYTPTISAPAPYLTVDANALYSMVLRKGGDDGSGNYRIPGLVTTNAGTIIAAFDVRWNGNDISSPDLPADIDTAIMRSTDGGVTWGPMQIIMDYDKDVAGSQGNGVGDPCIFVDRTTGRIWCASLWSKGNNGWNGSGTGLTPDETGQLVLNYSDDDGVTWTAPVSITPDVKDPSWRLYFQGPGKGICSRDGTLIFPAQYKDGGGTPRSNFIYSTDHGATWVTAPAAIPSGSPWTTEAQIVELDSGDLLLSMRNHDGSKRRLWCIYSWDHATETIADGSWGAPWYQETDPTVMGSVQRFRSVLDGHPWSGLLFANPDSTSREKMSIRLSLDEGQTWPYKRKIDDLKAAYSCMTVMPNGDIGILYETGEASSISRLVFARFPLTWLVGTADTDTDGIPDFDEDVLGLAKGDSSDAALDSDGDGRSNLDEYRALTDINDANSYLKTEGIVVDTNTTEVTVQTMFGRNYELQTSTTLLGGSWTSVGITQFGTGGLIQLNYPMPDPAEPHLFFRVRVSVP